MTLSHPYMTVLVDYQCPGTSHNILHKAELLQQKTDTKAFLGTVSFKPCTCFVES